MAYSTGMMNKRIIIAEKMAPQDGEYGRNSGGVRYKRLGEFWAAVDFKRGMKAMHEEAMDAFDTLMVRMRYRKGIDRDCLIAYNGRCYNIQSLNEDYQQNIIQMTVIELPDKSTDFYEVLQLAANGDVLEASGSRLTVLAKKQ